uniref:Uncharacterized protein n=1 Tax=Candidatus Kentrum sp. FM TaxID=2126340 RepID=A0A450U069_9GAMM|nr:MAG: hypothetical protein BECKFM1743A_GA0114220_108561 [Candidatus Kentron sp. FM]
MYHDETDITIKGRGIDYLFNWRRRRIRLSINYGENTMISRNRRNFFWVILAWLFSFNLVYADFQASGQALDELLVGVWTNGQLVVI